MTELRSITVGFWSLNGTYRRAVRRYGSAASEGWTAGGVRAGVVSLGAGARLPLNVLPTTAVSMAPFDRGRSCFDARAGSSGIAWMSAEPNRLAPCCAAALARGMPV